MNGPWSVTVGVTIGITRSRLPVAVSVIVAAATVRIVAKAERDADPYAEVGPRPETSAIVVASARVEAPGIVAAAGEAAAGIELLTTARIAAARIDVSSARIATRARSIRKAIKRD